VDIDKALMLLDADTEWYFRSVRANEKEEPIGEVDKDGNIIAAHHELS
jgi:hypothetical protein